MVDIKTIVDHQSQNDHASDGLAFSDTSSITARTPESLQLVDIICAMMAQHAVGDAD